MNFDECMKFINSYSRLGAKVADLSRATELMEHIGNPEKRLKFIHIAGTNGKGSTLEYIATALELSGYKTGKFTSPYVTHYADRIRINDKEIDERSLGEICQYVSENVTEKKYSQFEITMAIAMLWFEREKCDIVVLETGIGGLLDSTNVIPLPLVSIITSISLDHTAILGNTIEEIAAQKAGIIKEKSVAILSVDNDKSVSNIIRRTAEKKRSFFVQPLECNLKYLSSESDGVKFLYKKSEYKTAMFGSFQISNAVTAIEACWYLRTVYGYRISDETIKQAIATTRVQARLQYIVGNPTIVVDGGHNPCAVKELCIHMMNEKASGKKIYTITGMSDSKDYEENMKYIMSFSDKIFAVDDFASNSVPAVKIAKIAEEHIATEISSLAEAVEKSILLAIKNNGIVVICGSLYLASAYLNLE